jgi:hypothetical protein
MKMKRTVTRDEILEVLDYKNGKFFWKQRSEKHFKTKTSCKIWNSKYAEKEAGYRDYRGYIFISVKDKRFLAHRLAWCYVYGEFPKDDIDHINCDRSDNRIENLRPATKTQNLANQPRTRGEVNYKGVSLDKRNGRFLSRIRVNNKSFHIGSFDTAEEAHAAYCAKAVELFGEYANFGT